MNPKPEKLEQHTKEIMEIMLLAQSSFKIVDFIKRERSGQEAIIIQQNKYFNYTAEMNWRIYVIEMAKLFSTSDKAHWYNLQKLINKFKPDGEFGKLKGIDKYSIVIWEQNLELEKEKIQNLMLQRDKLYSHTDKARSHIKNELSFADANELLDVVKRIISEIHIVVFGKSYAYFLNNEPVLELKRLIHALIKKQEYDQYFQVQDCLVNNIDPKEMGFPE